MAEAIEQIEQDIATLKEAVAAIAQDTHHLYAGYLDVLGKAVRQQLIRASYHLCTQTYPDAFLHLSWDERQALQQALQQLGQQAERDCLRLLSVFERTRPDTPSQLSRATKHLEQRLEELLQHTSREANRQLQRTGILSSTAIEIVLRVVAAAEAAGEAITGPPNLLTALVEIEEVDASQAQEQPEVDSPADVVETRYRSSPHPDEDAGTRLAFSSETPRESKDWLIAEIEPAASETIASRSFLTDHDPADVDPDEMPEAGPSKTPTPVTAIYLRLGEIEFADPTVMAWRNRIRKLAAQLASLQREFSKKQRERTVAEAEAAWRASWSVDQPS